MSDHDTDSCFATLADGVLRIGNQLFERSWTLQDGLLLAATMRHGSREWLRPGAAAGSVPPARPQAGWRAATLRVVRGRAAAVEAPSLTATVDAGDMAWSMQVFPQVAAITIRLLRWPDGGSRTVTAAAAGASGIETDGAVAAHGEDADLCERLHLDLHHAHVHTADLADQTDTHDNLAVARELRISGLEPLRLAGCVFAIEDPLAGDGLLLLKHMALPHARPVRGGPDLRTWHEDGRPAIALHGHGAIAGGAGHAWTLAAYRGGANGRIAAAHAVQRCFRAYDASRDGMLLSNTWGDRNRDGRISAAFMAREIEAGAHLGIDVVQIDDGWQRGVTSNSVHGLAKGGVWQGFWAADASFWDHHPERFPDGLSGTAALARRHGMAFGLWFAPDSAHDFGNWRRDADAVLGFWRTHGVTRVKIDGVKAHSAEGEANLERFFEAVLAGSAGAVNFDLDVTAEVRPGYFGAMAVGPLFVENRYTDWHRWWPHATLRNLWQLAHWIDPVRLRMEFLNRNRQAGKYAGDPLAPAAYPADWLFASIMVASPLAWFEVSELPAADAEALRPLIALWKGLRAQLHGGRILPVGRSPDGASACGFLSLDAAGGGILVALREPFGPARTAWELPLAGAWTAQVLAGAGSIGRQPDGRAAIAWSAAPGYVVARLAAG